MLFGNPHIEKPVRKPLGKIPKTGPVGHGRGYCHNFLILLSQLNDGLSEDSRIIRAEVETYKRAGVNATLNPRLAGSWPGSMFTAPPLSLPAGQFGLGHGSGAHAPDEYFVVESSNPNVAGVVEAAMAYVDFFYQVASVH